MRAGMAARRRGGGGGGGRGMAGPMTVKQTADSLTVERQGRNGAMSMVYKLDGSESEITMGQMTAKATAKWDGSKLVITTKTDQGEASADLVARRQHADHRAHRRTRLREDNLQESDLVVASAGLQGWRRSPSALFCWIDCAPRRFPQASPQRISREPRHRVDADPEQSSRVARARTGVAKARVRNPQAWHVDRHRLRPESGRNRSPGRVRIWACTAGRVLDREQARPAARAGLGRQPNPYSVQIRRIAFEPRANGQRLDER